MSARLALAAGLILGSAASAAAGPETAAASALEVRARAQLEATPRNTDARLDLANALRWQGRWDAATTEYQQLLNEQPDHVDALFGLAQVRRAQGQPQAALSLLTRVRALAPDYLEAWQASLQTLQEVSTPAALEEARSLYDQARHRFPQRAWRPPAVDAGIAAVSPSQGTGIPPNRSHPGSKPK